MKEEKARTASCKEKLSADTEELDEIPNERLKPNAIPLIPLANYIANDTHFEKYNAKSNKPRFFSSNSLIRSMKELASLTVARTISSDKNQM